MEKDKKKAHLALTRRRFLATVGAGAAAVVASSNLAAGASEKATVKEPSEMTKVKLHINKRTHRLLVEPRWSLLFVLRERLGLTGAKAGCERGECGACTVLVDNVPRYACMTLAVQAEGSNTLVRYMNEGEFRPLPTNTIADSIDAEAPRNLYMAAASVSESNGFALDVNDDEILASQKELAGKYGVLAEPSAAASYAGYIKAVLNKMIDVESESMLMITGNGLKDIHAMESWNQVPEAKSTDEWNKFFDH